MQCNPTFSRLFTCWRPGETARSTPAITREKRIKKWNGAWKLQLIEAANPGWRDLAQDFGFPPLS